MKVAVLLESRLSAVVEVSEEGLEVQEKQMSLLLETTACLQLRFNSFSH